MIVVILFVSTLALAAFYLVGGSVYRRTAWPRGRVREWSRLFTRYQPALFLVFVVLLLACVLGSTIVYYPLYSRNAAADPAAQGQKQFWVTTILTGLAFVATQIFLFYFSFRFRSAISRKAAFIRDSSRLELLWTIVPTVCFIGLFIWSQTLWNKITVMAPDALEIEIVGEQFNWKARYPGADQVLGKTSFRLITPANPLGIDRRDPDGMDDFMPVQMHVPKGRRVRLLLRSNDVIHSFYVPYFRMKMDAVPGMYTRMQFTPLHTTEEMRQTLNDPAFNYEVACAELCGRLHFAMKLLIVVDEPSEFDDWYREQESWVSQTADHAATPKSP